MHEPLTVGAAAAETGWSARMLRYLEAATLVVPDRSPSGYRLYSEAHVERLRGLQALRAGFGLELSDLAFALRLRREPELQAAVEAWLEEWREPPDAAWLDWEQKKQERLLAA
jgi:MerR family transcriptional regulator, copper efflux regulator